MVKTPEFIFELRHRLASKHHLWWLLATVGLIGILFLARLIEPTSLDLYKQLVILYVIDSLLFFFTDRINAKMGILTLIFLFTMEIIVSIFYLISLFGSTQF
ncbi:MAG: hypothetical protein AAB613_02710 [Patescibacteria group bacterium]